MYIKKLDAYHGSHFYMYWQIKCIQIEGEKNGEGMKHRCSFFLILRYWITIWKNVVESIICMEQRRHWMCECLKRLSNTLIWRRNISTCILQTVRMNAWPLTCGYLSHFKMMEQMIMILYKILSWLLSRGSFPNICSPYGLLGFHVSCS